MVAAGLLTDVKRLARRVTDGRGQPAAIASAFSPARGPRGTRHLTQEDTLPHHEGIDMRQRRSMIRCPTTSPRRACPLALTSTARSGTRIAALARPVRHHRSDHPEALGWIAIATGASSLMGGPTSQSKGADASESASCSGSSSVLLVAMWLPSETGRTPERPSRRSPSHVLGAGCRQRVKRSRVRAMVPAMKQEVTSSS